MEPILKQPKFQPITCGKFTMFPHYCNQRQQHGWALPGCGFTTSRARAEEVALVTDNALR